MERRGIYRKGSAGHARNISSYKFFRQHMKAFRLPGSLILMLALVFGIAPSVGDELSASVLTPEIQQDAHRGVALQKSLLSELNNLQTACEKFNIIPCVEAAKKHAALVAAPDAQVELLAQQFIQLDATFAPQIALEACRVDLANHLVAAAKVQREIAAFNQAYGAVLGHEFSDQVSSLEQAVQGLSTLAEKCRNQ